MNDLEVGLAFILWPILFTICVAYFAVFRFVEYWLKSTRAKVVLLLLELSVFGVLFRWGYLGHGADDFDYLTNFPFLLLGVVLVVRAIVKLIRFHRIS